jgi:hypothetical protein
MGKIVKTNISGLGIIGVGKYQHRRINTVRIFGLPEINKALQNKIK